jgi:hypothetical protein
MSTTFFGSGATRLRRETPSSEFGDRREWKQGVEHQWNGQPA